MERERISDKDFVREMSILWQCCLPNQRNRFGDLIRNYFSQGERAIKIIERMQEKIEKP